MSDVQEALEDDEIVGQLGGEPSTRELILGLYDRLHGIELRLINIEQAQRFPNLPPQPVPLPYPQQPPYVTYDTWASNNTAPQTRSRKGRSWLTGK